MSIIRVSHLVKRYEFYRKPPGLWGTLTSLVYRKKQYATAVGGISFEIKEGEVVGFLGPNGAGKTTTLKILSGILYPTSGEAEVMGFMPRERQKAFQQQFGIVMGQKDQLARLLPAMDNFRLFQAFYGISNEEFERNVGELVEILGIQDILDIPVRKLSLGQRMKCELVGALLHNPRILFLDEPTIGLDVVAQKNIRDFIKKYNQQKKTTIVLTSHYMEDIRELCKRVIIINFGQIIYDGDLEALIARYATEKILRITTTEQVSKEIFAEFGKVEEHQPLRTSLLIPRAQIKNVAARLMTSDIPIDDLEIEEMPIDDIIRAIFEEANTH